MNDLHDSRLIVRAEEVRLLLIHCEIDLVASVERDQNCVLDVLSDCFPTFFKVVAVVIFVIVECLHICLLGGVLW